jgi:hypothetical protein
MVFRLKAAPLEGKPRWLTAGTIRLLLLCAFIVAVGMIRPRLTPHSAAIVLVVGGVVVVTALVAFLGATRRVAARLPLLDRSQRIADALMLQVRRTGLPLLGLAFFLFWTFVYLGLWWFRPQGLRRAGRQSPLRRLLLLRGFDCLHLSTRRHRGHLARRKERDDDRDADGIRPSHGVPVELRGLARDRARRRTLATRT